MGRSEPFSSLGTASLQDQTSILGCHSGAKAVRLCAAPVVGLEGPFGHKITILPSNETIRLNARFSLCQETEGYWLSLDTSLRTTSSDSDHQLYAMLCETESKSTTSQRVSLQTQVTLVIPAEIIIGRPWQASLRTRQTFQNSPSDEGSQRNPTSPNPRYHAWCVLCSPSLDKMIGSVLVSDPWILVSL